MYTSAGVIKVSVAGFSTAEANSGSMTPLTYITPPEVYTRSLTARRAEPATRHPSGTLQGKGSHVAAISGPGLDSEIDASRQVVIGRCFGPR